MEIQIKRDFGPILSQEDLSMRRHAGEILKVLTGFLRPNGFYVDCEGIPGWFLIEDRYVERVIGDERFGKSQCKICHTTYPTGAEYREGCCHSDEYQIEMLPGIESGIEMNIDTAFREIYNI